MKATSYTALATLAFGLGLCANAQERKIDRAALPAAVEKTVAAQSEGATIKGFTTEREKGKRVYEAEMLLNGHTRDVEIAENGTLNEIEEEVSFDSLPAGVQAGLRSKTVGEKITKVESLTKQGKLVAYEAATLKGIRQGEVQVGPDGGGLAHSE